MKTVLIKGVEHIEVQSSDNNCVAEDVWCGYHDHAENTCTHPEIYKGSRNVCANPPRMFVLPEHVPKFIKLRLVS